jgi:hypothetical protein
MVREPASQRPVQGIPLRSHERRNQERLLTTIHVRLPLPRTVTDPATLQRWFRQFVEVRDPEGAERCLVSAARGLHAVRQFRQ